MLQLAQCCLRWALRMILILKCYFADHDSLLDISSDPVMIRRMLGAWHVRNRECRSSCTWLPRLLGQDPVKMRPACFRLLPIERVISLRQFNSQGCAVEAAPRTDKRACCLQAMPQVAILCGSANTVLGADLMLQQDEARPLSDHMLQALSDERFISHRAAMRRWVDWRGKHAPIDQPFWKPDHYVFLFSRNQPQRPHRRLRSICIHELVGHVGVPFRLRMLWLAIGPPRHRDMLPRLENHCRCRLCSLCARLAVRPQGL